MDTFFILGAKYLYLLSILIFLFLFIKSKDKKRFIIITGITFVLSYLLAIIGRAIYFDPRPFVSGGFQPLISHSPDNGFISDHTLLVSAIAVASGYFHKRTTLYLWFLAAIVAISRVYVGVHNPVDVVGSAIIAIISGFIASFLARRLG